MAEPSSSYGRRKPRKIHSGEALGIIPAPTPHKYKNTKRYKKGDIDIDSIVAFLTYLRGSNQMPKHILRVRGRLRNAFPGLGIRKPAIRLAYKKAGWPINEIDWSSKRELEEAREREEAARKAHMNAF